MLNLSRLPMLVAGLTAGFVFSLASCGDGNGDGTGAGMGCVPQASIACACPNGDVGAQICLPDGTGFNPCSCTGGVGTGGGQGGSDSEGDMDAGADGTTGTGLCGNMFQDAGECDPTNAAYCPEDCATATGGGSSDGEQSCVGDPVFAMMIPSVTSIWENAGAVGYGAGNAMCIAMGADHVCDYEEIVAAATAGEFAAVPAGTTAWLHRTVSVMGPGGENFAPGVGGRCVDWSYGTNDVSDGEYVTFNGGVPTYTFDNDTQYNAAAPPPNPHVQVGLLECGGSLRSIPCCFPQCKAPV